MIHRNDDIKKGKANEHTTLEVWKKFSVAKNFPWSLGINVDPI